jgi:hypothetical protein
VRGVTPRTPSEHVPLSHDCCLTCWKMLDGEGLYPIFCVDCDSLRCPHATNHNTPCPAKFPKTRQKRRAPVPMPRRFDLGKWLRVG